VLAARKCIDSYNIYYMSICLYISVVCNPVECVVVSGLEVMDCYSVRSVHLRNLHGCHTAVVTANELNSGEMVSENYRLMRFLQFHKNWTTLCTSV
jgi:hypothetical protein